MGHVYSRGNKLWICYKGPDGTRERHATPFKVGQEKKAKKLLNRVEDKLKAGEEFDEVELGPVTIKRFSKTWLERRERQNLTTVPDDRCRLNKHVIPVLGHMPLEDVRPRHLKELVRSLEGKLAPRSIRHIYGVLHTMMADAVSDEILDHTPCVLRRNQLPKKVDKDPTWRAKAVFTRDEVEILISDERVPEDRRVLYTTIVLAAGLRFGEAAALRWDIYDRQVQPLGRLTVARSYSTHALKEKSVKTGVPRQVAVHPTLARVLAAWKLSGWEQMMGRKPKAGDLIIPSREGRNRNVNHGLKRFHQDLTRLGLRKRRLHDLRRTFISLALGDGARKDILRWMTHGPTTDIMDLYTTLPWEAYCREMMKLKIEVREGLLISLPRAATGNGGGAIGGDGADGQPATTRATPSESASSEKEKSQKSHSTSGSSQEAGWTGLEPAASGVTGRRYNRLNYHPVVGGTGLEPATTCV